MFSVGVTHSCMIAHSLPDPFFGPAQRLHGATYTAEVEVLTPALGPHQVVMDIGALGAIVRAALGQLDYRNLDEHAAFAGRLSTTERVAEHLGATIGKAIAELAAEARPRPPAVLRIRLRESPDAWASYEAPLPNAG
jgi:6-pyruvoyltetrahydropterin/6-carboxytetrahydropterin synthase